MPIGILDRASEYIARADMLIVGGTSLAVYPAADLVNRYHGSKLVLINRSLRFVAAFLCTSKQITTIDFNVAVYYTDLL